MGTPFNQANSSQPVHVPALAGSGMQVLREARLHLPHLLPRDRSIQYKTDMIQLYNQALDEAVYTLNCAREGLQVDLKRIDYFLRTFTKIALNDRDMLFNLANTKHAKDYIYHHSLNTCLISIAVAAMHGMPIDEILQVGYGALFHDVGMLLLPTEIRFSKSRLDKNEWTMVQSHSWYGMLIVGKIRQFTEITGFICYQIHERGDGTGYPNRCMDDELLTYSKIVQIADILEAETSDRPYRPAKRGHEVMAAIQQMAKSRKLNFNVAESFLASLSTFPVGSIVELNNSSIAKVVHANPDNPNGPVVSVLTDPHGRLLRHEEIYQEDLGQQQSLYITSDLSPNCINLSSIMHGM